MRKYFLPFFLCLICFGGLSCSNDNQKSAQPKADTLAKSPQLRVALLPRTECLPALMADEAKVFESHGLNVKLIPCISSLECTDKLVSGGADLCFMDSTQVSFIDKKDCDIVTLIKMEGELGLVTSASLRIRKAEDLSGRLVALSRNTDETSLLSKFSSNLPQKLTPILNVQINDYRLRLRMLREKQVEAAVFPQPWLDVARTKGEKVLYVTKEAHSSWVTTKKANSEKSKKALMEKFVNALRSTEEKMRANNLKADTLSLLTNRFSNI